MEDLSEEWEIQEYSCSAEVSKSRVRWIFDKGVNLGKKIVITGIVISSAPLVVPLLVVIFALGFVFSVPLGLVYASYACTLKVMNKLLPIRPPLMQENEKRYGEEEVGFGGDFEVEEDQMRGMNGWDEMGTEEEDGYWEKGEIVYHEPVRKGEDGAKEEGYEVDDGEYLAGEAEGPLEVTEVIIGEMGEGVEDKTVTERSKEEQPLDEVHQVRAAVQRDENNVVLRTAEELDLARATKAVVELGGEHKVYPRDQEEVFAIGPTASLEKHGDEGGGVNPLGRDKWHRKETSEIAMETEDKTFANTEEKKKPFGNKKKGGKKHAKLAVLCGELKGTKGEKKHEVPKENIEIKERRNEENVEAVPWEVDQGMEMGGRMLENRDDKSADSVVVAEKLIGGLHGSISGTIIGEVTEILEDGGTVANQEVVMQRPTNQIPIVVHETLRVGNGKKHVGHLREAAGVVAEESGIDLFDDSNEAGDKHMYAVIENPKEFEIISDHTPKESEDLLELHVGTETKMDAALSSIKVLLTEEKLWERIDALRTIVGYKVARHATCIKELKALYVFTGVEPPASFEKSSDLVEVNDKLQFLMSIVGVK